MDNWTDKDEEKLRDIIRDRLKRESRPRRDAILAGSQAFMKWFMEACFDIYDIIKRWVTNIWEWLFG